MPESAPTSSHIQHKTTPPKVLSLLGTGLRTGGVQDFDSTSLSYVTYYYLSVLWIPLFFLGAYRVFDALEETKLRQYLQHVELPSKAKVFNVAVLLIICLFFVFGWLKQPPTTADTLQFQHPDSGIVLSEGGGAQKLFSGAVRINHETAIHPQKGMLVQLKKQFDPAQEWLMVTTADTPLTSHYDAQQGSLQISGTANHLTYADVLSSLRYENRSSNPHGAQRQLQVKVHWVDGGQANTELPFELTTINDEPFIRIAEQLRLFVEDAGPVTLFAPGSVQLLDGDSHQLHQADITLSNPLDADQETLSTQELPAPLTASFDPKWATLTISGAASLQSYQQALSSVQYNNSAPNPAEQIRHISVTIHDGGRDSKPALADLAVQAVNDHPTVGGISGDIVAMAGFATRLGDLQISDEDLGEQALQVSLQTKAGQLALAQVDGLEFLEGRSRGVQTMLFQGKLPAINQALTSLSYKANNASGQDQLAIVLREVSALSKGQPQRFQLPIVIQQAPTQNTNGVAGNGLAAAPAKPAMVEANTPKVGTATPIAPSKTTTAKAATAAPIVAHQQPPALVKPETNKPQTATATANSKTQPPAKTDNRKPTQAAVAQKTQQTITATKPKVATHTKAVSHGVPESAQKPATAKATVTPAAAKTATKITATTAAKSAAAKPGKSSAPKAKARHQQTARKPKPKTTRSKTAKSKTTKPKATKPKTMAPNKTVQAKPASTPTPVKPKEEPDKQQSCTLPAWMGMGCRFADTENPDERL